MVSRGYTKRSTANAANAPAFQVNEHFSCRSLEEELTIKMSVLVLLNDIAWQWLYKSKDLNACHRFLKLFTATSATPATPRVCGGERLK